MVAVENVSAGSQLPCMVLRHVASLRHDPPHAAPSRPKPLIKNQNFAEGLLAKQAEPPC